jgi:hypothetical protein
MPEKKIKRSKVVTCSKCDREFSGLQVSKEAATVYVHNGNVVCKDCLLEMGVMPDSADPYSVYVQTIADQGKTGPGAGGF